MVVTKIQSEFNRQIDNLLHKGYPQAVGLSKDGFVKLLQPLEKKLEGHTLSNIDIKNGKLPFVIVIKSEVVPTEKAMSLLDREGKRGVTKLYPLTPQDFHTIERVDIPNSKVYLLIDVDRGKETINIPPKDALPMIQKKHRSPLTIDEGVAIITQFPQFLMKNNCFSLLASRNPKDKRVPAIWINAQKNLNLGWCWDGYPHTWLGAASCRERIG